jgi:alkyldihydroxyacetonephosphate synthase
MGRSIQRPINNSKERGVLVLKKINYKVELLKHELGDIVGKENVVVDQSERDCQSVDVWWITRYCMFKGNKFPRPDAIVFPEDKEQVVKIIKYCNEHNLPVIPRGGGANDSGGVTALNGGIVVDTKKMDKIIEINEKSLTVRVQTGILQKHLEEQLNRRGYTMNHFPASINTSTLGGFISNNGTGILSSKYGKLIDMVHQLEVVLPDGQVFKSLPVNHHSTGPDYSKLFIGAEGTFGIITEALCKIYPLPEKRSFMTFLLPNLKEGLEAGRKIMTLGLNPSIMRFYDKRDTNHILKNQYGLKDEGYFFMAGFDGVKKVVDAQSEVAYQIFKDTGGKDLSDEQAWEWWNNRLKSYYPPLDYICEPWLTAVMDTAASYEDIEKIYWEMKSAVEEGFKEYGALFHAHFSHWYNWGNSFYPTFVIKNPPEDEKKALDVYHNMIDACVRTSIENGGIVNEHHGIGLRCGRFMKEVYKDNGYDIAKKIKHILDPKNIMNPGKLGFDEVMKIDL